MSTVGEAGDVYTTLLPTDGYVLKVMFKSHLVRFMEHVYAY